MVRLILIRHGETEYNLQNRYCGFSNPPLNNKGIWQAERLACRLKDTNITKVYSSDLNRAYETAKIVFNPSTTLRVNGERSRTMKNNAIEKTASFREMDFGLFEGLRYDEISKSHSQVYQEWFNNPQKVTPPKGERFSEFVKRIEQKLSFILSKHKGETLAVVTHGGPIRVILCKVLSFDLETFWRIDQELAALNIIDYPQGASPRLVKMNDTSHLSAEEGDL